MLHYGNPLQEHVRVMRQSPLLRAALAGQAFPAYLAKGPGPLPCPEGLWAMVHAMRRVTPRALAYLQACEDDHFAVMARHLRAMGLPGYRAADLEAIAAPYQGPLYYAKYQFNAPRPHALAYALGVPLYPLVASDANSPATPGGHALDAFAVAYHLTPRHPAHAPALWHMARSVAHSRVLAGLHYPGDGPNALALLFSLVGQGPGE